MNYIDRLNLISTEAQKVADIGIELIDATCVATSEDAEKLHAAAPELDQAALKIVSRMRVEAPWLEEVSAEDIAAVLIGGILIGHTLATDSESAG